MNLLYRQRDRIDIWGQFELAQLEDGRSLSSDHFAPSAGVSLESQQSIKTVLKTDDRRK